MAIKLNNGTDYINTNDYRKLENRLQELKSVLEDLTDKSVASRKLRYAEVDIEVEREAGRLMPDEMYVPYHVIDTNIRREQASYVEYITKSPRAVVVQDKDDPSFDLSLLEKDLSDRLRFDGWQLSAYSNIDAFQANGYGIMEIVYDDDKAGDLTNEAVSMGDFAFVADTKDIQAVEMVARTYHYTKTRLLALASEATNEEERWDSEQVNMVVGKESESSNADPGDSTDSKDRSLYKVQKVMYRVNGIVQVGWAAIGVANDWLRMPRPLYLGRRELIPENKMQQGIRMLTGNKVPPSKAQFETDFPYCLYQYLISENDTIAHLKGRIFLDQDAQEAVTSLMSSTLTQARRASGMYFSKDTSDANDDILLQKNIFFRQGALINSKVTAFKLDAPDPGMFTAVNALLAGNQNETSQVTFATSNRKDSRKTAEEMKLAQSQENTLSTVQVVLYSISLTVQYRHMSDIIKSRVLAGIIVPNPKVLSLYSHNFTVKPSGDTDVVEKQQLIQTMMSAWSVIQNTGAADVFLVDLLEMMFPNNAAKYVAAIQQAKQQQQSQQAQQMQQMLQFAQQMAQGITMLSKEPDMFSDVGKLHALPVLKQTAMQIKQIEQQLQPNKHK